MSVQRVGEIYGPKDNEATLLARHRRDMAERGVYEPSSPDPRYSLAFLEGGRMSGVWESLGLSFAVAFYICIIILGQVAPHGH